MCYGGAMTARAPLNLRIGSPALTQIDQIAKQTGANRSEVVRMALRIILANPENLIRRLSSLQERT